MDLAAGMLKERCRRILVTDLIWPPYLRILRRACRNSATDIHVVSLRRQVYEEQMSCDVLLQTVIDNFRRHHCDGLFLTAIDHCGARFPVATLLQHLSSEVRCSVVDASQAFGQVPTHDLATADFIFGSTHKWLGSYFPLCLGFAPTDRTQGKLRNIIDSTPTDPLLSLADSWTGKSNRMPKETVNLGPLFAASGGISDSQIFPIPLKYLSEPIGEDNRNWRVLHLSLQLNSRIILLRNRSSVTQRLSPAALRQHLQSLGIAVTTYAGGYGRISVPAHENPAGLLSTILRAVTARRLPARRPNVLHRYRVKIQSNMRLPPDRDNDRSLSGP